MSEENPFSSSPEEKQAGIDRMRARLMQRLTEAELLPMGFEEGPRHSPSGSPEGPRAATARSGDHRPSRKGLRAQERPRKADLLQYDWAGHSFQWVRRSVRFHPVHLAGFNAYCAARRQRQCDVLARILADFIESEEFKAVVRMRDDDRT